MTSITTTSVAGSLETGSSAGDDADTQTGSATQRTYNKLRRMIVLGELKPGEQLKIEALRGLLNTGASPIREALSLLTSDQLVERFDKRGFRAACASEENFQEILKLRCSLEDMALRQSIANASKSSTTTPNPSRSNSGTANPGTSPTGKQWEEFLVLAHHRMVREPRENVERFEDRHKAFHMALLSQCASPILLRFCDQLYDLNIRYRYLAGKSLGYQQRDVASEHEGILQAAINFDAALASERLQNHYRQTGAFLAGLFAQPVNP